MIEQKQLSKQIVSLLNMLLIAKRIKPIEHSKLFLLANRDLASMKDVCTKIIVLTNDNRAKSILGKLG